jgi:NAD(P)H-dependent flavin oxidoreductase YrpB (nitropropane dioxygenase family)
MVDIVGLGLPVWLAGSHGTPSGLRSALAAGAVGVQVGTAFAYCEESGFDAQVKERVLAGVVRGQARTRSDWRVSPTGFPFRVVELADSLSDPAVRAARVPVCDLGMLRSAYLDPEGKVGYRCPAEAASAFVDRKRGRAATMTGRVCLCNALFASAGFPQRRRGGYVEPPLVTAGSDLTPVADLLARAASGSLSYRAADVVAYLLSELPDDNAARLSKASFELVANVALG